MIIDDDVKYVIVQAGGKGTRMGQYAQNRPKCLVPIDDIPMIINTLNIYKDKEVIIIADHLADVLENYLKTFYKRDTTEGSWIKCPSCEEVFYKEVFVNNFSV